MNLKPKVLESLNQQINHELAAAYAYLAMAAHFEFKGLPGFASWMRAQWQEELVHAMKIFDYVNSRGDQIVFSPIKPPAAAFTTPASAFEAALQYERNNTQAINAIYELARSEKDHATEQLLHWFIQEQVEEEDSVQRILDKLALAGDNPSALLFLDHDLAQGHSAPEA